MSFSLRYLILSPLIFVVASATFAQTPPSSEEASAARSQWQRLQGYEHAHTEVGSAGRGIQVSTSYQARADELRDFRLKHANDPQVPEARRLEALMLLYAGQPADKTLAARRDELVTEVRKDAALPSAARFGIASMADHTAALIERYPSEEVRLLRCEEISRALLKEFPDIPQPLEAMLNLADDCPEGQLVRMATDVLKANPPAAIRARAEKLLARHGLVGQRLESLFMATLPAKDVPATPNGRITILYIWATWHPGSLLAARDIISHAPARATIIGVNVDTDVAAARQVAAQEQLPGTQLYDPDGLGSKLATALQLTGKDVVYLTNRQGAIRTVTARRDLVAQLGSAND